MAFKIDFVQILFPKQSSVIIGCLIGAPELPAYATLRNPLTGETRQRVMSVQDAARAVIVS